MGFDVFRKNQINGSQGANNTIKNKWGVRVLINNG